LLFWTAVMKGFTIAVICALVGCVTVLSVWRICTSVTLTHFSESETEVVYVPPTPPCAFQIISETTNEYVQIGRVETELETWYIHDTYQRYHRIRKVPGEFDRAEDVVIRSDISTYEDKKLFFWGFSAENRFGSDRCAGSWIAHDNLFDDYIDVLKNETFSEKTKGTFGGKEYDMFLYEDDETTLKYFVNEEGYVIGIDEIVYYDTGSSSSSSSYSSNRREYRHSTCSISYKFFVPMSSFVIDPEVSRNCDARAYVPPNQTLCPDPTSSSSSHPDPHPSTAATVQATLAMIILSIVAAFVSFL